LSRSLSGTSRDCRSTATQFRKIVPYRRDHPAPFGIGEAIRTCIQGCAPSGPVRCVWPLAYTCLHVRPLCGPGENRTPVLKMSDIKYYVRSSYPRAGPTALHHPIPSRHLMQPRRWTHFLHFPHDGAHRVLHLSSYPTGALTGRWLSSRSLSSQKLTSAYAAASCCTNMGSLAHVHGRLFTRPADQPRHASAVFYSQSKPDQALTTTATSSYPSTSSFSPKEAHNSPHVSRGDRRGLGSRGLLGKE
jgi:hypothetical protein